MNPKFVSCAEAKNQTWTFEGFFKTVELIPTLHAFTNEVRDVLIDDMLSEYDARFLREFITQQNLELSPQLQDILAIWSNDETKHYRGFRLLYEALYGDQGEIDDALRERRPDFTPFESFITDEYSLSLVLAYDELVTVRSLLHDLAYYENLGHVFGVFIRRVASDESSHYAAFLRSARRLQKANTGRTISILETARRLSSQSYRNTFLFDHQSASYPDSLLDGAKRIVATHL